MAQLAAKVTRVTQLTTINSTGQAVRNFVVTYDVGEHGPFTLTVPEADFSPEKVQQLMQNTVQTIQTLTQ